MQLSKQEFSKLPKSEQNKLMNLKAKGAKQAPKKKANKPKPSRGQQASGKQASVAAAYATRSVGKAPAIRSNRDTCNIKHREFIGNVQGSVGFVVGNNYSVNPGLPTSFPWLSVMAQGWEEYKFRSLRYCYYTRTGSNTPGSVILAPDYDASDAAPATEQIISSYDHVVEDAPWKDSCCVLKSNLLSGAGGRRHFVRTGPLGPNEDIKLYDVANFFVGTVDGTAIPWGKLWVEYDIDFFIPQLPPHGISPGGGAIVGGGVLSAANPLGSAPVLDPQSQSLAVSTASVVTFPTQGTYLVSTSMTGTGITGFTMTPSAGGAVVNEFQMSLADGTQTSAAWVVSITASNATITVGATATTVTASRFLVGSAPANSLN